MDPVSMGQLPVGLLLFAMASFSPRLDELIEIPFGVLTPRLQPRLVLSRTYIVFFDPASTLLKPRSQLILQEFVAGCRRVQCKRVEIVGHTDAEEARRWKASLSLDRANAVADVLVASGIAPDMIISHGQGNDSPLVPADGAEPQNRCVILIPR